jgi:hypothetical protein
MLSRESRDAATILFSRTLVDAFNKSARMGRDVDELQAGAAIIFAAPLFASRPDAGSARHADARILGRQGQQQQQKESPARAGLKDN